MSDPTAKLGEPPGAGVDATAAPSAAAATREADVSKAMEAAELAVARAVEGVARVVSAQARSAAAAEPSVAASVQTEASNQNQE